MTLLDPFKRDYILQDPAKSSILICNDGIIVEVDDC